MLVSQRLRTVFSSFCVIKQAQTVNYVNFPQVRTDVNAKYANFSRFFSASSSIATFDDVKEISNKKNVYLIDVREPNELKETGVIPGSINIPLGEVEHVLKNLSPEEFKKKFGIAKPKIESEIIFHCMIGKRSATAQEAANRLGFRNVKNYLGSWTEWAEKMKS